MHEPTASISAYREGPYLVRGPVRIVDEDGREVEIRRDVVALCRCGRSRSKPLCDGTHAAGLLRSDPAVSR
jgi:CDGSH-type Zn-finger protein